MKVPVVHFEFGLLLKLIIKDLIQDKYSQYSKACPHKLVNRYLLCVPFHSPSAKKRKISKFITNILTFYKNSQTL